MNVRLWGFVGYFEFSLVLCIRNLVDSIVFEMIFFVFSDIVRRKTVDQSVGMIFHHVKNFVIDRRAIIRQGMVFLNWLF